MSLKAVVAYVDYFVLQAHRYIDVSFFYLKQSGVCAIKRTSGVCIVWIKFVLLFVML